MAEPCGGYGCGLQLEDIEVLLLGEVTDFGPVGVRLVRLAHPSESRTEERSGTESGKLRVGAVE